MLHAGWRAFTQIAAVKYMIFNNLWRRGSESNAYYLPHDPLETARSDRTRGFGCDSLDHHLHAPKPGSRKPSTPQRDAHAPEHVVEAAGRRGIWSATSC